MLPSMPRNTKPKMFVENLLEHSPVPLGLREVLMQAKKVYPRTAFSTVYRIVQTLEKTGFVTRVDFRDRGSKYEWAAREHHHHITCDRCGHVEDIKDTAMGIRVGAVAQKTGYALTAHTIELAGICPDCQTRV